MGKPKKTITYSEFQERLRKDMFAGLSEVY